MIYSGKKKWAEVDVVDGKLNVVWHYSIPMKGGYNRKENHLRNVAMRMRMEKWKD